MENVKEFDAFKDNHDAKQIEGLISSICTWLDSDEIRRNKNKYELHIMDTMKDEIEKETIRRTEEDFTIFGYSTFQENLINKYEKTKKKAQSNHTITIRRFVKKQQYDKEKAMREKEIQRINEKYPYDPYEY